MSKKAPGAKIVEQKSRTTTASTSSSKSPTVTIPQLFLKQLNESYQEDVEAALVKVVCGLTIPPYATDSKWWHDFMATASCGCYHPVSGTMLVESLIANEAAFVWQQTISYLQSSQVQHIMWGFNGGATRCHAGFLTIHATDDKKCAHFIDATDTSEFDHTGELYANMVLRV